MKRSVLVSSMAASVTVAALASVRNDEVYIESPEEIPPMLDYPDLYEMGWRRPKQEPKDYRGKLGAKDQDRRDKALGVK